jgi:hypothetical protein
MRFVLAAAVALAAITAAFALPAGARMTAPGPQCGGTLWKQMTLSDTGKSAVHWTPAATTVPDIGKLSAPAKIGTTRSTAFQKQVWHVTAVIQSFRMASNGELVLQLFDIPSSTYMNAYMPSAACLVSTARGRAQMIATRNGFLKQCGAASNNWTPLGATADLTGVGFWNSVKTTAGALKNGAELRPVLSVNITQGCGVF